MKKLSLKVEHLAVESFETTAKQAVVDAGTVRGHQVQSGACSISCAMSCTTQINPTCSPTCWNCTTDGGDTMNGVWTCTIECDYAGTGYVNCVHHPQ